MRVGKLTSEELQRLILSKIKRNRSEVLLSSALSEDTAAVKCDDVILVTTDPITASVGDIGRLTIDVSANDIAASGGEPFACVLTLIAPTDATLDEIEKVVADAAARASELNVDIIGGHTEYSDSVNRIITNCAMLGRTKAVIKSTGAKVGDSVIITKFAGLEGTMVLANDFCEQLGLTEAELLEAKSIASSISVRVEGAVGASERVHSMHDVTEGGVFGAVCEMCQADGSGVTLFADKVPFSPLTKKICDRLKINPYRLLSSGSLIMTTDKPDTLIKKLKDVGVLGTVIGVITDGDAVAIFDDGRRQSLTVEADELLKIERKTKA